MVCNASASAKRCLKVGIFGRYTVQNIDFEKDGRYLICRCSCGKVKSVRSDSLERGDAKSCGCLLKESIKNKSWSSKGGKNPSTHPLYYVLYDMHRRCYDTRREDYKHYGGRGIEVCDRWNKKTQYYFDNFLEDMGSSWKVGLEIERVDTNGNYTPENCIWSDRKSQVNNTNVNRLLVGWGVKLSVTEWTHLLEISNSKLLDDRVNHCGKGDNIEVILNTPLKDRAYSLLYKGEVVSASYILKEQGVRNLGSFIQNNGGDSLSALDSLGIKYELLKPREKEYLDFDEAMFKLSSKSRTVFEEILLTKIQKQMEKL